MDPLKTPAVPGAGPPSQADQAAVGLNQQSVENLARIVQSLATDKIIEILGQDLGGKVIAAQPEEKRKTEAQRQEALALAVLDEEDKQADEVGGATPAEEERLSYDQQVEVFRCRILGALNLTKPAEPMRRFAKDPLVRRELALFPRFSGDRLITQGTLTPTTGSAGAFFLPDDFIAELEKRPGTPKVVWPLVAKRKATSRTVKKSGVTTYVTANRGSSANVNSATTATEITETVPVFNQLEWNLEDFDTRIPMKLDLLEESPIDVYAECLELCADAFDVEHERLPLIGQGHGHLEPEGLMMGISGITTVPVNAAPTVDNVLDFVSEIPMRYRGAASLLMNGDTFFSVIAVLAQNVRAAQFLTGNLPPMKETEYMVEGKVLGGDFSRYVVQQIRLYQVITSIHAERKAQELVVTETWTGRAVQTDAFRIGTGVTYA